MGASSKVHRHDNGEGLSHALAAHVVRLAAAASAENRRFSIALSGGSLLGILGTPLGSAPLRDEVDWSTWHVFWADERWVPWSSPDSNYGVAERQFLSRVGIPQEQVHGIDNSLNPLETAQAYESTLAAVFQQGPGAVPRFDLVLLGIGEDGHTASLFPGHAALQEIRRWVVPVFDAPKPPPIRITMTLPIINNARNVVIVASGPGKTAIVSKALDPTSTVPDLPIRRVSPSNGELWWFVDRAAVPGDPEMLAPERPMTG